MQIQAVLFDLDNTLTHRDLSVQAYAQFLVEHFDSDLEPIDQDAQNCTVEIIRKIDNGGYPIKEYLTHPSIAGSVAYALLKQLNWRHPPSLADLTQFWFDHFGLSAVAMPGAESLLAKLKAHDFKLAVISNGGHATRLKILEGLGFLNYFDQIFSSESVGIAKPKAGIFLHSCREINIQPENSLYIGDHPMNDYIGSSAAGLNSLLLEGFHPHLEQDLYEKFNNKVNKIRHLHEVIPYLNQFQ